MREGSSVKIYEPYEEKNTDEMKRKAAHMHHRKYEHAKKGNNGNRCSVCEDNAEDNDENNEEMRCRIEEK